jgi:hypothetical protein
METRALEKEKAGEQGPWRLELMDEKELFEADLQLLSTSGGILSERPDASGITVRLKSGNLWLAGAYASSQLLLSEAAALPGLVQLECNLCVQHDGFDLGRQFGVCSNGVIDSLKEAVACGYCPLRNQQLAMKECMKQSLNEL